MVLGNCWQFINQCSEKIGFIIVTPIQSVEFRLEALPKLND
jgi:hypothetical protein